MLNLKQTVIEFFIQFIHYQLRIREPSYRQHVAYKRNNRYALRYRTNIFRIFYPKTFLVLIEILIYFSLYRVIHFNSIRSYFNFIYYYFLFHIINFYKTILMKSYSISQFSLYLSIYN